MQHDFRFSSKSLVLVRALQNIFLSAQSNFNYCRKVKKKEKYFDKYKNKKLYAKIRVRLLQYSLKLKNVIV